MASSFVHLDVRSCFSLKEGAFTPEQLAHRAAALDMPAVAMTDRDGLYGAARFVRACEREGVRPILGASLTVRAPTPPPEDAHVVLLATDDTGYANLCRLLTDAHMLGERGDPWVDPLQICAHAAGMIALVGPGSHPGRLAVAGRTDAAARLIAPLREAFGRDRCVVAVEHRMAPGSTDEIRAMLRLAERADVPAVATNPARYLVAQDAFIADALECMRKIVPRGVHERQPRQRGGLPQGRRADACASSPSDPDLAEPRWTSRTPARSTSRLHQVRFPDFPVPGGPLGRRAPCRAMLARRPRPRIAETEVLRARLHHELTMIRQMGYAAYFLTVADIAADIRSMGIRAACRGSAAGSLVCYLIRISDVDALAARPGLRAVLEPDARRASRHRHRCGVGATRGRLRHDPVATRDRARRLRRHGRHLPCALGRA